MFQSVCQQIAQHPYIGDPAIIRCGHFLFKNINALNKHFSDSKLDDVKRFLELKASFCNKVEPGYGECWLLFVSLFRLPPVPSKVVFWHDVPTPQLRG